MHAAAFVKMGSKQTFAAELLNVRYGGRSCGLIARVAGV